MIGSRNVLDVLQLILPLHCQRYLLSKNWKLIDQIGDLATIWESSSRKYTRIQAVLPMDTYLDDYKSRMAEFVETLHVAENRSQDAILADLIDVCMDKLRIKLQTTSQDTVKFANASWVMKRTLDMMIAVANSVIETRPHHRSRYPKQIQKYIDKLELGHTERGSFVFKIHSPVVPALLTDTHQPSDEEIPFERKVMQQLSELLKKSIITAGRGDAKHFEEAVKQGMSSNFCDALADIVEGAEASEVMFDFSWSTVRPVPFNTDISNFVIRRDIAEVLKGASSYLKTSLAEEGAEIVGYVVRLDKEQAQEVGEVKVVDISDDQRRSIFLKLGNDKYQEAIVAHQEGLKVSVVGDLERKHNRFEMTKVSQFSVYTETQA